MVPSGGHIPPDRCYLTLYAKELCYLNKSLREVQAISLKVMHINWKEIKWVPIEACQGLFT